MQIQPTKRLLDQADLTAPTLQHEVGHTDPEYVP